MTSVRRAALGAGTGIKEMPVKAYYYRIVGSLAVLSALAAILAAPKKWG
jgi:hypothetical protein